MMTTTEEEEEEEEEGDENDDTQVFRIIFLVFYGVTPSLLRAGRTEDPHAARLRELSAPVQSEFEVTHTA